MTDLHDALQHRADRGRPRGAMAVLDAARGQRSEATRPGPDRHRRVTAVVAVAVVVLLVAVAVLVANRDEPGADGPVDDGQIDTTPNPEVIEGPLFGAETDTTLLVSTVDGLVAVDLDTGVARRHSDIRPSDAVFAHGDRLVYAQDDALWSSPLDLGEAPVAMPGLPNGREAAADLFHYFPAGDTDRFWVTSGPWAEAPQRSYLAEERTLAGDVVTLPIDLGRSDAQVVGATSELVAIGRGGVTTMNEPRGDDVIAELPGAVLGVAGDRVVWKEGCAYCPLHVTEEFGDPSGTVEVPGRPLSESSAGVSLSPDGERIAYVDQAVSQGGEGTSSVLRVTELATGETTEVAAPSNISTSGLSTSGPGLLWAPDSQWVFAVARNPDDGGLLGYRVGDEAVTTVTLPIDLWALTAIARSEGPQLPPRSEACPEGDVGIADLERPCRLEVYPGLVAPTPPDEETVVTIVPDTTATTLQPGEIARTDIPVVVANGSGVAGAAGAVTNQLTALGYIPGLPMDTTVPIEETPLDTVYYITVPENFEAQARQVAADLGLPPEAVLSMPSTLPVRPEDLGLAAVLVVLGSAPGGLVDSVSTSTTAVPP